MSKYTEEDLKVELETKEYEYGFYTNLDSETFPKGLNEDIVRAISAKKEEPQWMTDWRIEAFRAWQEMTEPNWANVHYQKPDFQAISYYSAPKKADPNKTLDDVDSELLAMYAKLGISIDEQKKAQQCGHGYCGRFGVFAQMNHLGSSIGLLVIVGYGYRIKFTDRIVTF